jgi:hypothetical protein
MKKDESDYHAEDEYKILLWMNKDEELQFYQYLLSHNEISKEEYQTKYFEAINRYNLIPLSKNEKIFHF